MIQVTAYSLLLTLAVAAAGWYSLKEMDRLGISRQHFWRLFPLMALLGYLGARLFFVLFAWEQFEAQPLSVFAVWQGGFALFGAFIPLTALLALYSRRQPDVAPGLFFDAFAAPMALAIAIGRLGDFSLDTSSGGLFSTESLACALLFSFLRKRRGHWRTPGDSFLWACALYGALRTVTESMRQDSLYLGFVRVSQVCAALLPLVVAAIFLRRNISIQKKLHARDWAALALLTAGLVLAFLMEFNMGSGRETPYRLGIALGMSTICAAAAVLYR